MFLEIEKVLIEFVKTSPSERSQEPFDSSQSDKIPLPPLIFSFFKIHTDRIDAVSDSSLVTWTVGKPMSQM